MNLCNSDDCVGCGACVNRCPNSCISMIRDSEGFEYPIVDKKRCMGCNSCIEVCPINVRKELCAIEDIVYGAKSKNDAIRGKSSSGGIFPLIAQNIIDKNGVVVGAGFDSNYYVKHYIINKNNDLNKLIGSKYMQSHIGKIFLYIEEFLEQGRWVMFSGTPCQVAGLKSFLGKQYDKLICVDFICHGVPSETVWDAYLDYLSVKKENIQAVSFRNKVTGWKNYSITIKCKNNISISRIWNEDLYMRGFVNDLYLRKSCYNCKFKGNYAVSDITLGDFWGLNIMDSGFDDDLGTTIIRLRSDKGKKVFNEIVDLIDIKKFPYKEAIKYNPSAEHSSSCLKNRQLFYQNWKKEKLDKVINKIIQGGIGV